MGDRIAYQVQEQLSKSSRFRYVDDATTAVYELEIVGVPNSNRTQEAVSVAVVRRYLFADQKGGPYKDTLDSLYHETSSVHIAGANRLGDTTLDIVSALDNVATSDIKQLVARMHSAHPGFCSPAVFKNDSTYS